MEDAVPGHHLAVVLMLTPSCLEHVKGEESRVVKLVVLEGEESQNGDTLVYASMLLLILVEIHICRVDKSLEVAQINLALFEFPFLVCWDNFAAEDLPIHGREDYVEDVSNHADGEEAIGEEISSIDDSEYTATQATGKFDSASKSTKRRERVLSADVLRPASFLLTRSNKDNEPGKQCPA